jgi:hypothetical protein
MRLIFTVVVLLSSGFTGADDAKTVGVTPEEAKEGFVSLFDGKTLNGWNGDVTHYAVEDGVMVCHGANVYTEKEYDNFILRFEFKLPPGGNNGVGIRTPNKGVAGYVGMEIQLLDDGDAQYKDWLQPYQAHGSIYGVVPAKRGFLKPVGQWNQEEIVADGSHIKVTLNGVVITDADLSKIDKPLDDHVHPGLHNPRGYIGWLGHDSDPVAFRNVRIKNIP